MDMRNTLILTFLLLILASCTSANQANVNIVNTQQVEPQATLAVPSCDLKPIVIPTLPKVIPGYTELDKATGLHMTGTAQVIDLPSFRLQVNGLVKQPLSLQYDELRCLPKVTASPPLVCSGYFKDQATWSGVPINEILKLAHPMPQARTVTLISADGFRMDIDLETAMNPMNFLAYELEGQPLPILHGFPLRAVFPDKEGLYWVKWLVEIRVS
jgi:DMSO/TMAO reductase YedYZ molybdopterin-dependent catalytic subunit